MPSLLLLANPAASGFTGGVYRDVTRILGDAYDLEVAWPEGGDDARLIAAKAAQRGVEVVAALGGDGVAHVAANGLAGSETSLALIPVGTTNVLARLLNLPSDPVAAAHYVAAQPHPRRLPLCHLRGSGREADLDTYAAFSAGAGLDADIVALAELEPYRKYRFGSVHYLRTALTVVAREYRRRPATLQVSDGDRQAEAVAVLFQVHEPYTYFGWVPLSIAPEAPASLAVLVVEHLNLARVPAIVLAAVRRRLDRVPGMQVWTGVEHFTVHAEPPTAVQADGEALGEVTKLVASHVPRALSVLAPAPLGPRPRRSLHRT